jgi:pilus assembly protein CpaB
LKRSNRLVLLIGIFLAMVVFVLVAIMLQKGDQVPPPVAPTTTSVVVAAKDVPLGTKIVAADLAMREIKINDKPADSYADTSFVVGQTARVAVTSGQLITSSVVNGQGGSLSSVDVPAGYVGIAVKVDQSTGVGTLIRAGDHVDVITGITSTEKVPLVTWDPLGGSDGKGGYVKVSDDTFNHTSVKTLAQGLQVLGTLLPPAAPAAAGTTTTPNAAPGITLNDQEEIVLLAVTAQQAEIIKFAQMDGQVSLVLRSAVDCQAADGTAAPCPSINTTGITLRGLVDTYGVIPPQVVQVIQPAPKK